MIRVRARQTGGQKAAAAIRKAKPIHPRIGVEVGFFDTSTYPESGVGVPQIAAIHEFGAPNNKMFGKYAAPIPERPFFRQAMPAIRRKARQIAAGQTQITPQIAGLIGAAAVGELQASIVRLKVPDLSPTTKEMKRRQRKKGPHNPLIDTGNLRTSATFEVVYKAPTGAATV